MSAAPAPSVGASSLREQRLAQIWVAVFALLCGAYAAWLTGPAGLLVGVLVASAAGSRRVAQRALLAAATVVTLGGIAAALLKPAPFGLTVTLVTALALQSAALLAPHRFNRLVTTWAPLALLVALDAGYLLLDSTPPAWDQARHLRNVLRLDALAGDPAADKLLGILGFYDFYTPVSYWVGALFVSVLGHSYAAAALSMPLFWVPVAYVSVHSIARRFFGADRATASLAAFVIVGGNLLSGMSKQLMQDVPGFAMVALVLALLGWSGFLRRPKRAFIVGLAVGLGVLTKTHTLVYVAPFLGASLLRLGHRAWRERSAERAERFVRSALAVALGALIAGGPWFLLNADFYKWELSVVANMGSIEGDPEPATLASLLWYPRHFSDTLTLPVLLLLAPGWVRLVRARRSLLATSTMVAAMVLTYVVFTATWNKDARYALPATLLLLPGVIGLVRTTRPALLAHGAMAALVAWTVLVNVTHVSRWPGNQDVRVAGLLVLPAAAYTLPGTPRPASEVNAAEAMAAFVRLYSSAFRPVGDAPLELGKRFETENGTFNTHNWRAYHEHLHRPASAVEWVDPDPARFPNRLAIGRDVVAVPAPGGEELAFLKDSVWNDYYLLGITTRADGVEVRWRAARASLGGDVYVDVDSEHGERLHSRVRLDQRGVTRLPLTGDVGRVRLSFQIAHSWSPRWPLRLTSGLIGQKNWNEVPLVRLTTFHPDVANADLAP